MQHDEGDACFHMNNIDGHEDPSSQASLEDLCRSHLVRLDSIYFYIACFVMIPIPTSPVCAGEWTGKSFAGHVTFFFTNSPTFNLK